MKFDEFIRWKTEFSSLIWPDSKTPSLNDQSSQHTHQRNTLEVEKMRIFETAKQNFASMEMVANKPPLHRKQLLHIVQSLLATSSLCLYLVYETNNTREYLNSVVMTTAGTLGLAVYLCTIFKMASLYDCADRYETAINKSKRCELNSIVYARSITTQIDR